MGLDWGFCCFFRLFSPFFCVDHQPVTFPICFPFFGMFSIGSTRSKHVLVTCPHGAVFFTMPSDVFFLHLLGPFPCRSGLDYVCSNTGLPPVNSYFSSVSLRWLTRYCACDNHCAVPSLVFPFHRSTIGSCPLSHGFYFPRAFPPFSFLLEPSVMKVSAFRSHILFVFPFLSSLLWSPPLQVILAFLPFGERGETWLFTPPYSALYCYPVLSVWSSISQVGPPLRQ